MTKVTILLGGTSCEREISLKSGENVAQALQSLGYDIHKLDVGHDLQAFISTLKEQRPDCIFNALHGTMGEDGTVQAILNWLAIPYTHSGMLASALAMHKDMARQVFHNASLHIAPGRVINIDTLYHQHPIHETYVLKPLCEGSSVGVNIIHPGTTEMAPLIKNWHRGEKVLVEKFITGPEVTVGILNGEPLAITDISIAHDDHEFYDYQTKYRAGWSQHTLPACLSAALTQTILNEAKKAHDALGCRNVSRVDFKIDMADPKRPIPTILEVNTQPGMTTTSLLPEQALFRGISFEQLCDNIIQHAECS